MKNLKDGKVVVLLDFINYLGEVLESTKIAEFRNKAWAECMVGDLDKFLDKLNEDESSISDNEIQYKKYRIEFK